MSAGCAIAILAKAPLAGFAKTRLAPALGAAGAAALAGRLLEHAAAQAVAAGLGPVVVWAAPDAAHPAFERLRQRHGLALAVQGGGDLGARMARVFEQTLAAGAPRLLLMGSDAPALDAALLRRAAAALDDHDAVFVPAFDGGYALVGLRVWDGRAQRLFDDMPWSTPRVMAETRDRLAAAGLGHAELPAVADIDEPADLEHLPAALGASSAVTMSAPRPRPPDMPDAPAHPPEPATPDAAAAAAPVSEPATDAEVPAAAGPAVASEAAEVATAAPAAPAAEAAAVGGDPAAGSVSEPAEAAEVESDSVAESGGAPAQAEPAATDAPAAVETGNAENPAVDADAITPASPASPASPAAPPAAADLPPAACAARLAELFPALFGAGRALPIKLRIQNDIQQRAPGIFTRRSLSAFLHRHTNSTAYLKALVNAPSRFDLDGAAAGEIDDVHHQAAAAELERRRGLFEARRAAERAAANEARRAAEAAARQQHAAEDQARRDRAALLRAYESSTLTRTNFCVLKGIAEADLDGQLHQAWLEREQRAQDVRPPIDRGPAPRDARSPNTRPDARRGSGREARPGGRPDDDTKDRSGDRAGNRADGPRRGASDAKPPR